MPVLENGWERWRGEVNSELKHIRADLQEIKGFQKDARISAMQFGGILGGLVSGIVLTLKWFFTKGAP